MGHVALVIVASLKLLEFTPCHVMGDRLGCGQLCTLAMALGAGRGPLGRAPWVGHGPGGLQGGVGCHCVAWGKPKGLPNLK